MTFWKVFVVFYGVSTFALIQVESCNEQLCSSIVTKCMLTETCKCEPNNCPCRNEFISCLGQKYSKECCDCAGLCPDPKQIRNKLSKKSHVEEFDGIPELFNALITSKPEEFEWEIITYAVGFGGGAVAGVDLKDEMKYFLETNSDGLEEEVEHINSLNCSVIYMSSCVSWNKCRQSCQSLGASSYRWFHDGCCECVGETCINYGLNESRCKLCPESMEEEEDFKEIPDDDTNSEPEPEVVFLEF